MPSILILSSHSNPQTSGPVNHQVYASRNGYDYLFDLTPLALTTPYDQKLEVLARAMRRSKAEWVLWVDDDAYFMQMDKRLEAFIPSDDWVDFVFCRSPVNLDGHWSFINSGVFFVRNNEKALSVLEDALRLPMATVEAWWDHEKYGIFIPGGDQERLTYLFETQQSSERSVIIHDHTVFNSRVYHFIKSANEYFVCHLASHRDKSIPLAEMIARFGLDKHLLSEQDASSLAPSLSGSVFSKPPRKPDSPSIARRAARRLKRFLRQ